VLHYQNYAEVIEKSNALRGLVNGLLLGAVVVVLTVLFSSMAAFYIARTGNRLSKFFYSYFVSGLIIPIAIVPTYFTLLILHLNNTYTGLIVIFVTYTLPLSIFLYTGFMKTVPRELDEAAIVDGCSSFQMFAKVIFPLLGPVSMTVIVFNFIGVWNEVQAYLFFAGGDKWPLPMTVYLFFGKYSQSWNLVFANILISIIPSLLLFMSVQKYIVSGLTAGAVKG